MTLTQSTMTLLDTLDALSQRRLNHREDLGILLDLGALPNRSARRPVRSKGSGVR